MIIYLSFMANDDYIFSINGLQCVHIYVLHWRPVAYTFRQKYEEDNQHTIEVVQYHISSNNISCSSLIDKIVIG